MVLGRPPCQAVAVDDGSTAWLAAPVRMLLHKPPLLVEATTPVADVAAAMRDAAASSAVVTGRHGLGLITDSDLRSRVVAARRPPETPAAEVMTAPVRTLTGDAPASAGLMLMLELGAHHIPVLDGEQVLGVLTDDALLRDRGHHPLLVLERVRRLSSLQDVTGFRRELVATVRQMETDGVDAARAARVAATLSEALVVRVLELSGRPADGTADGDGEAGPASSPWAFCVLGSAGRRESGVGSDLDSAMVHAAADDPAACRVAASAVAALHTAGFPPCPGGFEADTWCRSLAELSDEVRGWLAAPSPQGLLHSEVMTDLRPVAGDLDVAPLVALLRGRGAHRDRALWHLAAVATSLHPPLGMFAGRLGTVRTDHGRLDVKRAVLAPVVMLARFHAAAVGADELGTPERLAAAAEAGTLSADLALELQDAFALALGMRLRLELDALAADPTAVPEPVVDLRTLPGVRRRELHRAMRAVHRAQEAVAMRHRSGAP